MSKMVVASRARDVKRRMVDQSAYCSSSWTSKLRQLGSDRSNSNLTAEAPRAIVAIVVRCAERETSSSTARDAELPPRMRRCPKRATSAINGGPSTVDPVRRNVRATTDMRENLGAPGAASTIIAIRVGHARAARDRTEYCRDLDLRCPR